MKEMEPLQSVSAILKETTQVAWHWFNKKEQIDIAKIGIEIGNEQLMHGLYNVLRAYDIDLQILNVLSNEEWARVTIQELNQSVWKNLREYIAPQRREMIASILKDVKKINWFDFYKQKDVVEVFLIGKKNGNNLLMQGVGEILKDEEVAKETLKVFSVEDLTSFVNGKQLNKTMWQNLTRWIELFPQHKDQLPSMLANVEDVDWYDFSNEEIEQLFFIGKQVGAKPLIKEVIKVLEYEAGAHILPHLSEKMHLVWQTCQHSGLEEFHSLAQFSLERQSAPCRHLVGSSFYPS
jgi:hypothetical protein